MNCFAYIREKIPQTELLAQLAEEATELAHAALKLRRAYDGTNPTPVSRGEALENLKEEVADVELVLALLDLDQYDAECNRIKCEKLERWARRLEGRE